MIKNGDMIAIYGGGYKKVTEIGINTMTNNPNTINRCMYRMMRRDYMTDDLIVSGEHQVLVDTLTPNEMKRLNIKPNISSKYQMISLRNAIERKCIKIGSKYLIPVWATDYFHKIIDNNIYNYCHLVLEGNDTTQYGIWANGVLSESTSRNIFKKYKFKLL